MLTGRTRFLPGIACIAICAMAAGLHACSAESRYRVLSRVFDDVPRPGETRPAEPVKRSPRRPPAYPPEPPAVKVEIDPEAKRRQELFFRDWKAFFAGLPKTATGAVDWVRALETGAIKPATGIDPKTPASPVLPLNVELQPKAMPMFTVTFPHKPHTEWLACNNCHTSIFQMRAGADDISMAKIYAGRYCGKCHGKVAFAVNTGCPRCHLKLAQPQ